MGQTNVRQDKRVTRQTWNIDKRGTRQNVGHFLKLNIIIKSRYIIEYIHIIGAGSSNSSRHIRREQLKRT